MSEIGMNTEGGLCGRFPGLTRCSSPTRRIPTVFGLKPFDQRKHTAAEINARSTPKSRKSSRALASPFAAADFRLGQGSGYSRTSRIAAGWAMARCKAR
ncbi:MAG: hypothetical protein ACLT2V_10015 [Escherichia coli]